jgi:hypothetical protein
VGIEIRSLAPQGMTQKHFRSKPGSGDPGLFENVCTLLKSCLKSQF